MQGVKHRNFASRTRDILLLDGFITTTTLGAIDSAGSANCRGFTVARAGAGDYTLTLAGPGGDAASVVSILLAIGTARISAWVAGKGLATHIKSFTTNAAGGVTAVNVEFIGDAGLAADVPDGAVVHFLIACCDSLLTS